jgi:Glycosyltransferase
LKILHVTEAYGGGVTSAINTYVAHSMQFDHYLFACVREEDKTGEEADGLFRNTFLVDRNFSALLKLKKVIKALQPDVIHLHSTYAGFFVRLMPFIKKTKVVYTPHGYAFLRNQHPLLLKLFYIAEWILGPRTQVIAGCGRDEQNISKSFVNHRNTIELINVSGELPSVKGCVNKTGIPIISMVGRISAQKDFDFFADVASKFESEVVFKWIGGGCESGHKTLTEAGVIVTGWLTRQQVISELSNSSLYFHSAAWDGFPISVLEAAKLNIPIVLRGIGPFTAENLNVVTSVSAAEQEVRLCIGGDDAAIKRADFNRLEISRYHTSENLSRILDLMYLQFKVRY